MKGKDLEPSKQLNAVFNELIARDEWVRVSPDFSLVN